jgi:5-methylcytosine-specific restriction endonuclease McrA
MILTTEATYSQLLLSEPWKRKREEILKRDQHQCCNCGSKHQLEVHHRQYHIHSVTGEKRYPWDYANTYLITLCATCHMKGHHQFTIPVFKH